MITPARRWKAILSYDGSPYHGWQIQPGRDTVQGALAESLLHITGESTLPQGSGRTDTGVHALAQVAHFDLVCNIPPENLHRALNRSLPPSIRVLTIGHCPPDFHARHSALHKTYEYRILPRPSSRESICPPFLAPYLWACPSPLSLELLSQAAPHILGTHDFTSFAAVDPDRSMRSVMEGGGSCIPDAAPRQNIRTIFSSVWFLDQAHDPPILRYRVTGSGFLHHMVRNLVGAFTECGANRRSPEEIPDILSRRDRRAAGPTAPPHGLFLAEVAY